MLDGVVPRRRRMDGAMPQEGAGGGSSSGSVPPAGQRENEAVPRPGYDEEERKRKGKMPAVDQSLPPPPPPVEKKLMGDAIRAHANASTSPPLPAWKDAPFDYGAVSQRLRDVLEGLGVVAGAGPVCVYEKEMTVSDRGKDQNRLLISCKDNGGSNGGDDRSSKKRKNKGGGGDGDEHRAAANFRKIFTAKELLIVHQEEQKQEAEGVMMKKKKTTTTEGDMDKEKEKPGLGVQAYDRDGEMYQLKCRHLMCNSAYRIIKDYARFLENNGLLVRRDKRKRSPEAAEGSDGGQGGSPLAVGEGTEGKKKRRKGKAPSPEAAGSEGQSSSPSPEPDGGEHKVRPARIELWAFRSPKLTQGCTDHADGKLGLVLLHYLEADGAEAELAADEPEPRSSEEEDAMEPAAMPNVGEAAAAHQMAVDVPDVVVEDGAGAHEDAAVHAHADAVPVIEPAMPDVGAHEMAVHVPDVVVEDDGAGAHEDAVHVHADAVPVMEPAMPNVGAHAMAVHVPAVVLPVLAVAGAHEEDAVHAPNEDAVPVMDADERTRLLEAAEGLLLLSKAPVVF
uniref:Uncharacterized protein n=2 Tax=Triticum aestivum TaxID=4565 RepID=A0A3B6FED9_WHEAT